MSIKAYKHNYLKLSVFNTVWTIILKELDTVKGSEENFWKNFCESFIAYEINNIFPIALHSLSNLLVIFG